MTNTVYELVNEHNWLADNIKRGLFTEQDARRAFTDNGYADCILVCSNGAHLVDCDTGEIYAEAVER